MLLRYTVELGRRRSARTQRSDTNREKNAGKRTAEEQHRVEPAPKLGFPIVDRILVHAASLREGPSREVQAGNFGLFRLLSSQPYRANADTTVTKFVN